MLFLAFVLAFSRPHNLAARIGAWFLASVAIAYPSPPYGVAAIWRHLPTPLGGLLWVANLSVLAFPAILLTFFAIFPRKLLRTPWTWVLVWSPPVFLICWGFPYFYHMVYRPDRVTGLAPPWLYPSVVVYFTAYVLAGLLALLLNYRRLEDPNERRRMRVLVLGTVVGWIAPMPMTLLLGQGRLSGSLASFFLSTPAQAIALFLYLAFPLSLAYAILRHRLFDVRVMIRQGLQYAVARGMLVSAVPALAAIFLLDLLLHGDQPAAAILRARGWIYVGLGALALVAQVRQKQWLAALDRRFFRERYAAQRLLREVVEEVRQAGGFERVVPRVVARIEAALHPEFVALLVRDPREANYRTLAAAPAGQAPPPLRAESKLLALMRVLGKPLEVSLTESGWLKQQLPHEETDFLRQARIDLLVPVAVEPERREALLALGAKRSEEPYTGEDQDLLVAIATSLVLLLEKPVAVTAAPSEALEECPRCGTCYDTGAGRCAQEGANLVPMHLPRLLAGRYKLERRRGRGGMGTVYEALDTALERRVAVKVIRDDLVGSAEAAERFRREARVAASFAHPNVVTVYDFGVAADTRAFLVMELLDGSSLREELQKNQRLPAQRAVEILRGVCAAVEVAHRRQFIHRDLKPENIFLACGETGEVPKVLDFGIAKFLSTAAQATADTGGTLLVGTLHYMAPEHLRGEPAHAAWDLWALAVVAYEMLTGAQPFAGTTGAECHSAVLMGRFTPVSSHLPEAPRRWQEFFLQAFALDRAKRPGSARLFLSELERSLA
jgi:tRNA A-37 threonylcarbamoyl transferase component Bud32